MAKQRKLLYPSGPDSFFDDMEREVNSTKRKKCKKVNPVPPEKLFLQFDPSKKDDCSSKKVVNSQPSLMQKPYWKPPIKMFSQPDESFELCKKLAENSGKNEENICSVSKENTTKVNFSNNDNVKIFSNCLEENKSENGENYEKDEENAGLIIINSSPDSSEKMSPETLLSDNGYNNCSEHGDSYETTGEVLLLDNKTETATQKIHEYEENIVINTSQKEDMTAREDCLQRLATDANCYIKISKPNIPSQNSSICQDINAIMSEEECPDISMEKMSKLSNNNNVNESSDALDEEKLSSKEDIHKEDLNTEIGQQSNKCNLNPTQSSKKVKSQIVETKSLKSVMTANSKNSEELKNINLSEVLDKGKLSLKEEIFVKELDTEIGQQNYNNLNLTQCSRKAKFEIDEILSATDMTANAEKSEIIIENTVSKTGILCAPENSKSNPNEIQDVGKIAQIDAEQFHSVFDASPIEIKNSQQLEIESESNEHKQSLNTDCNVSMPENSCIKLKLAHDVYIAPDITNQNILPINDDNNDSVRQNPEQDKNSTRINVNENLESNINRVGENETNVMKEDEHLTKDCHIENNNTLERNSTENEIGEGEKEENTEFEQLLEEENKIQEEKVYMDEEYSCLMISNSQLAEIEKNYYESSQHTVANEVSKVSDINQVQLNPLMNNENKNYYNCSSTKGKFKSGNVTGPPTEFGLQNSSNFTLQNIPPKFPSVQWPKNMLETQKKIRDLVGEVERLNSLLMGFRREIWPQKHSDDPSS